MLFLIITKIFTSEVKSLRENNPPDKSGQALPPLLRGTLEVTTSSDRSEQALPSFVKREYEVNIDSNLNYFYFDI
jgi:hypothetical protein